MTEAAHGGPARQLAAQLNRVFGDDRCADLAQRTKNVGWTLMALAFAGLGAAQVISGEALPNLQPVELSPLVARASGLSLLANAAVMLAWPRSRLCLALAIFWGVFAAVALADAIGGDPSMPGLVPFAELMIFTTALVAGAGAIRCKMASTVERLCAGFALILFGAVHIAYREAISGMIPGWIPFAEYWPWFTGVANLLAGIALVVGRGSAIAAMLIAAMYLAWLPVVHAARLIAEPGSLTEWTFALTALALAGCLLSIAGKGRQS